MQHVPGLYIAPSPLGGRGVFSLHPLQPDDTIEICPIIRIPKDQQSLMDQTVLHDYYFLWPDEADGLCIALGYGSLYNHSSTPNAEVTYDLPHEQIIISCSRPIEANEEILIDYTGGIRDAPELWFEVH